jgi:hypothetical protein
MEKIEQELYNFMKVALEEANAAIERAFKRLPPEDTRIRLNVLENQRVRKATEKKIDRYWEKNNGNSNKNL